MRRRDTISVAIGGLALLTSVLVMGGVLRWTQAIVAVLVAAALGAQLLARRKLDRKSPLVVLVIAAIVLTALQLVPLPAGVLDWLDSTGNHLRADGAAIANTSPWQSISLDPAATLRELAFFVTLLGVAVLSLRLAASERGRFALLGSVAVVCGLTAAVTGVHTLVNADSLYGLYEPLYVKGGPVFGPLLNPNHLGGLMAIGTVLSVGLSFYHRQPTQFRVLWIVTGVGCAIVGAASLSRGAMIGLVIGLVATGVLLVAGRLTSSSLRKRRLRDDLPVGIVVALGLAVALYMSAGSVVGQLGDTSVVELGQPNTKYAAWKSSLTLVGEAPLVGIGRGATESTLTRVFPGSSRSTFSHLENEYLSAVVEWGVIGALLLAGLLGWGFLLAIRRWRDGPLAAAALGALAAIMFQSSVDFGVELLGLAVPVTMIAATVLYVPLHTATKQRAVRLGRIGLIVGLLAAAGVLLLPMTRGVREDHDLIVASDAPTIDDVREAIERHPLDYLGFGEAANMAWHASDPKAVQYLNHALTLHPTHPGLHRTAARMLVAAGRYHQAAVEYMLAMGSDPAPRRLLTEVVANMPDPNDAAASIPTDYYKIEVMLHALKDIERQDISLKWLARVAQRPEHDLRVIDRLYQLAIERKDLDAAMAAAELRWKVAHTTTSHLMLAKVQFAREQYDTLLKELANIPGWTGRIDEKAEAWFILCDVHIAQHSWDAALECLHRLDASGMLVSTGRRGIDTRLHDITEHRTYESKMKAAELLEKSLAKPKPTP